MEINGVIYNAELMDIIIELQNQLHLNGINLINDIKESGDNIMITCPYHANGQERHPSFGIQKYSGIGNCLACHETHPLTEIISHCFGYNDFGLFGKTWLLKNFNSVALEDRKPLQLDLTRNKATKKQIEYVSEEELDKFRYYHSYWKKRGITSEWIIELFDLGYDIERDCITFPIRDEKGNCLFVARRHTKTKYFNYPANAIKPLYGAYELTKIKPYPTKLYITESMLDCLKLWEFGEYAIALNGLGSTNQMKMLNELPCRQYVLATDMDIAGKKARKDIAKNIRGKIITELIWDGTQAKDINDMDLEFFKTKTKEVF